MEIRTLKSLVAILALIAMLAMGYILVGSLAPSDRADAVQAQWRFAASALEGLSPGEIRTAHTELGPVFIIAPNSRIDSAIESQSGLAKFRHYDSFDADAGAFILWGIVDRSGATRCTAILRGPDAYVPEPGDIYDPCGGARFDFAGRVLLDSNHEGVWNLRRPIFERVSEDEYQVIGLSE